MGHWLRYSFSRYFHEGNRLNAGSGYALGFKGQETVRFGDAGKPQLVVPVTIFGQADNISTVFQNSDFDGK